MRRAQSRSQSMLEAGTNVAVGFIVALVIQSIVVYPLFGIATTFVTDGSIAVIFTLVSLLRSYLVRRAFEAAGRMATRPRTMPGGERLSGRTRSTASCPPLQRSPAMRGRKPKPTHLKLLEGKPRQPAAQPRRAEAGAAHPNLSGASVPNSQG